MSRVFKFLRQAIVAGLFLIPVLAASSEQAQAGALDGVKGCLQAAEAAAQIAQLATDPQFVTCSAQLASGDPALIAMTVVMGALAATGNISSADTCKALIYGSAANFVGDALVSAGVVSAQDGETIKNAAQQGSTEVIQGVLGGLGIGQYVDCSCAIAGNAVESVKLMVALAEHGQQCAGMAGQVAKALVEGVASGIYGAGEWVQSLGGTALDPCTTGSGGYIVESSYVGVCQPGKFKTTGAVLMYKSGVPQFVTPYGTYNSYPPQWEDQCGQLDPDKQPKGYDPNNYPSDVFAMTPGGGACFCPPGTTLSDYGNGYGTPDSPKAARCECPKGLGYTSKGTCEKCPAGQIVTGEGVCSGCPAGTKFWGGKCVAACPPGLLTDSAGNCTTCPSGSVPSYVNTSSSAGKCSKCSYGTTANPGEQYCVSLCNPDQEWNGKACQNLCSAGKHPTYPGEGFTMVCESCPANTFWNTQTRVCQGCPSGASWDTSWGGAGWCSCPAGQAVGANGKCTQCKGIISSSPNGNICIPCPGDAVWKSDGKGGGYCYAERPFIKCTGNSIPDPKAPYEKCVACPAKHYAYGSMCIPSGPIGAATPNYSGVPSAADVEKTIKKIVCPPGTKYLLGVCIREGSGGIIANDCKKLGSNYVSDPSTGACRKCPMGRIANAAGNACVLGYSLAPSAPNGANITVPQDVRPPEAGGGLTGTPALPQQPPGRADQPPASGNTGTPVLPQTQPQREVPSSRGSTYTPPSSTGGGYSGQTSVPSSGNYKP